MQLVFPSAFGALLEEASQTFVRGTYAHPLPLSGRDDRIGGNYVDTHMNFTIVNFKSVKFADGDCLMCRESNRPHLRVVPRTTGSRIVSEALDLMSEKGLHKVRIPRLADRLGISKEEVKRQFKHRRNLLTAMAEAMKKEATEIWHSTESLYHGELLDRAMLAYRIMLSRRDGPLLFLMTCNDIAQWNNSSPKSDSGWENVTDAAENLIDAFTLGWALMNSTDRPPESVLKDTFEHSIRVILYGLKLKEQPEMEASIT
jgi:AcrR family transcriptional regulator